MKINRAAIEVTGLNSPLEIGPLPSGITVVTDAPQSRFAPAVSRQIADLISESVFGLRLIDDGELVSGHVDVGSAEGPYRLMRVATRDAAPRFTVSSLDGKTPASGLPHSLLHSDSAEAIAAVFYSGKTSHDDLDSLLSESVAARLHLPEAAPQPTSATNLGADALLARRDEVALEIEKRINDRRRRSEELEALLVRLDAEAADLSKRRAAVESSLRAAEASLAEVESSLRYAAIAEQTERAASKREAADWRPRVEELDAEIERWRATLAELELREAKVRSELSIIHPDDGEPTLPLADQRAGLAVARRLVEDLESEVARLARAAASEACVCNDAHPRLNPLVDTLGRQLTRLAELGEQQERALHAQSLLSEAAHLGRSQDDLRQQIDHLLDRRQALWRTTRARPEEESVDLENQDAAAERADLDQRRAELKNELEAIDARLAELAAERDVTVRRRSALLSDAPLEALQAELDELQARLQQPRTTSTPAPLVSRWRASEWFAKLVDGRYAGLRLAGAGRRLVVIEPDGAERPSDSLSPSEQRLAAISLRLALVGGFSQCGVRMPLVFDDPFAGLSSRQSAILANVLDDFSRLGFQVLVFTESSSALDRFRALGAAIVSPQAVSAPEERVVTRRFEVETPTPAPTRVVTRVEQSEYLLAPEDPIERFPVPIRDRTSVFARSRVRTVEDLLTADPSALAEELDRDDVTAELAALWQTHTAFVCFVPGMTFEAASLLTALGVYRADELAEADADQLHSRLTALLATDRGARFRGRGHSLESLRDWIAAANRGLDRWRGSSAWEGTLRHRGERRQRVEENRSRPKASSNGEPALRVRSARVERTNGHARKSKPKKRELRFHLNMESPMVDAPSIGPKTADRLAEAGYESVADLIAADPEEMAEALDNPRITAETIVTWQHQSQLMCRIPELRGHDAAILVECGFTQPEEVAEMKPAELLEFVGPFCDTPEGQRVLRSSKAPDLAEVTDWIEWAQHCRTLGAA